MKHIIALTMLLSVGCSANESKPTDVIGGELKCTKVADITRRWGDLGTVTMDVAFMECNDDASRVAVGPYLLDAGYGINIVRNDTHGVKWMLTYKGKEIGVVIRLDNGPMGIPGQYQLAALCTFDFSKACDLIAKPLEIRLK